MSDTLTTYESASKWADIVLERWAENIASLHIVDTGELLESLTSQVERDANCNPDKIVFTFMYYGIFPDLGVGKGTTIAQRGNSRRKAKPWYSTQLRREVSILANIMAQKYGEAAARSISLFKNAETSFW